MPQQAQIRVAKGNAFRALHQQSEAFIIPNPWDIGSARLLAHLGFEALATTSAGHAFSLGQQDGTVDREQALEHIATLVAATDLPVSADLENGFGDAPETVATGLVGGSIEDATGHADAPIYDIGLATERIRAAAEAARALPYPFMLTARCENYLFGRPDLADTIRRLQAFQEAGADVLFAPGLKTPEDIAAVVQAVDRPVNVVMGLQGMLMTRAELSELGVKRISIGGALARAAYGAVLRAGREMLEHGSFEFANEAVSFRDISAIFAKN